MENRENARYIILANVNGKKTAIHVDGLYTILPPQNFPPQIPQEIQYNNERLPLYDAKEVIGALEKEPVSHQPYEQMYRDLLLNVKDVSDEIVSLKKNILGNVEEDLTNITQEKIPVSSQHLTSILTATEEAANNIMDLTDKVQESQVKIREKFKNIIEDFKKQEEGLVESVNELEAMSNENDEDLGKIVTSLSFQDLTGQKLKKVVKLQGEVEYKLISILFDFGIKLKKEENPDDANIKKGEEMLELLKGEQKESVNQEDVDQLLEAFF